MDSLSRGQGQARGQELAHRPSTQGWKPLVSRAGDMDSLSKGQARGQELAHRPWVGEHEESCSSELAPGLEAVSIQGRGQGQLEQGTGQGTGTSTQTRVWKPLVSRAGDRDSLSKGQARGQELAHRPGYGSR